jgi:hypothetical protein
MLSGKKYLFSLLSIVYAIILLHNLTPHEHGSDNHKSFGLLSEWFQLLFGKEHHKCQDKTHLSTFSIQQDDELAIEYCLEISDFDSIEPILTNLNLRLQRHCFLVYGGIQLKPKYSFCQSTFRPGISDRAPPFFAEIYL